jgi:hypothetical protein
MLSLENPNVERRHAVSGSYGNSDRVILAFVVDNERLGADRVAENDLVQRGQSRGKHVGVIATRY